MKVFVLLEEIGWANESVESVHASRKSARKAMNAICGKKGEIYDGPLL